jgi:hypothetical protein
MSDANANADNELWTPNKEPRTKNPYPFTSLRLSG